MNLLLIFLGKFIILVSRLLNLGNGSTWPGHIALNANKNFIKDLLKNSKSKIIFVAGTNGKTTTVKLIESILRKNGKTTIDNTSGANLLNGIASTIILNSDLSGKIDKDFAIFEIDENTLPLVLSELTPDYVVLLNLFRDQLDRYGEVNIISNKWAEALKKLNNKTTLILNADDPEIATLRLHPRGVKLRFFGLNSRNLATSKNQHAVDSTHCPKCDSKLEYSSVYYSHLGIWKCTKCDNIRPKPDVDTSLIYPLSGIYNQYNTNAAVLVAKEIGIKLSKISSALSEFKPAFGRQEILDVNGKRVQIFLSKNPTGFNESLKTILNLKAKNLLIILNDRIPDGRDVSWIWDVDFEDFIYSFKNLTISGERLYDMALRIKYTQRTINEISYSIEEDLGSAITSSLKKTPKNETLYILPTYSAMLETRRVLTGKKIL